MQIMFAVLVAIGWVNYSLAASTAAWHFVILAIATIYAFFKVREFYQATLGANNIVAAAATFATLSSENQDRVKQQAQHILMKFKGGAAMAAKLHTEDDAVRFGWYALAMGELGIPPVVLTKGWYIVRNPFLESIRPSYYLKTALQAAAKKGYPVNLVRPVHDGLS